MENPEIKNAFGLRSFARGIEDAKKFTGTAIEKFRISYAENREAVESFLKEKGDGKLCLLHFDFQGKHWHQFKDELKAVNNKLLDDFVKPQNEKFVLRKSLYKMLASPEKNLPFPNFTAEGMYKTKVFDAADDVMDLLYAINYSTKAVLTERDIKLIILPKGNSLTPEQIEDFFERGRLQKATSQILNNAVTEETKLEKQNLDSLFAPVLLEVAEISMNLILSSANRAACLRLM